MKGERLAETAQALDGLPAVVDVLVLWTQDEVVQRAVEQRADAERR